MTPTGIGTNAEDSPSGIAFEELGWVVSHPYVGLDVLEPESELRVHL